jgi:hypothetical protein
MKVPALGATWRLPGWTGADTLVGWIATWGVCSVEVPNGSLGVYV